MQRSQVGIVTIAVAVVAALAWWFFGRGAPARPPEIEAPLAEMQKINDLPEAQRREKYREIRNQVEQLGEEAQRAFRREMRGMMEARIEQRFDEFFAAPTPQERNKVLDKHINEMEKMRAKMKDRKQPDRSKGQGQVAQGRPPGGRGRGGMQDRLDRTTPEQRAKRAEYRKAMEQRRKDRGLPQPSWPRPRA